MRRKIYVTGRPAPKPAPEKPANPLAITKEDLATAVGKAIADTAPASARMAAALEGARDMTFLVDLANGRDRSAFFRTDDLLQRPRGERHFTVSEHAIMEDYGVLGRQRYVIRLHGLMYDTGDGTHSTYRMELPVEELRDVVRRHRMTPQEAVIALARQINGMILHWPREVRMPDL